MIDFGGLKISDLFKIVTLGSPHVEFLINFLTGKVLQEQLGWIRKKPWEMRPKIFDYFFSKVSTKPTLKKYKKP